jgi:hypothetical protein
VRKSSYGAVSNERFVERGQRLRARENGVGLRNNLCCVSSIISKSSKLHWENVVDIAAVIGYTHESGMIRVLGLFY